MCTTRGCCLTSLCSILLLLNSSNVASRVSALQLRLEVTVPHFGVVGRWQKLSLWSWFGGSGCTIISEAHELAKLAVNLVFQLKRSSTC